MCIKIRGLSDVTLETWVIKTSRVSRKIVKKRHCLNIIQSFSYCDKFTHIDLSLFQFGKKESTVKTKALLLASALVTNLTMAAKTGEDGQSLDSAIKSKAAISDRVRMSDPKAAAYNAENKAKAASADRIKMSDPQATAYNAEKKAKAAAANSGVVRMSQPTQTQLEAKTAATEKAKAVKTTNMSQPTNKAPNFAAPVMSQPVK